MVSSQALLLFAVGVTLYATFFHWALTRHLPAGRWLVAWSTLATLFIAGRFAQMGASEPTFVVTASRFYTAIGPLLVWTMLRFALELAGRPPSPRGARATAGVAFALAAAALATPWFVQDATFPRADLFGRPFLSARGGPGFVALGAFVGVALGWILTALWRSTTLRRSERLVLGACLAAYGAMGAASVLSFLGRVALPGIAEFGPLVVAFGTTHLIANRERELQTQLNGLAEHQTAALQASEERTRGLVENAPIGILACDVHGNVVSMTPRFREILSLGREPGSPGRIPANLFRDAPERAMAGLPLLRRTLEHGATTEGEIPYATASGPQISLKVVIAPRRNAAGELLGALILIEDVTERRTVEARLRQSLKLEAIGQLAVGIAQGITAPMEDVRERLAAMRANAETLRKELADAGRTEPFAERLADLEALVDESCEGVERAIGIVRDMREISQGRSLAAEALDLNALLDGVLRMAATHSRGAVQVAEHYAELPRITANAGQLRQVFLNLAVNAIQAAGPGGHVTVETLRDETHVCVRLRDDGPGIPREHRSRLFVPFFTTKPAGEGTGLGLFLSYQIVQSHGGEIRVHSEPGAGATFEVWLPIQPPTGGAEPRP